MEGTAGSKVRVGVVGLGRSWETRYKPALARLRDQFKVTAIYDQVARRAEIEAKQSGCRAVDGLTALVTSTDVDAVAWLAPQWFGTHIIELAAHAGKPIYCSMPFPDDPASLAQLADLATSTRPQLVIEHAERFTPATRQLLELIDTTLGVALSIRVDVVPNHNQAQTSGRIELEVRSWWHQLGQSLVDWARVIFGSEVEMVLDLGAAPGSQPQQFTVQVVGDSTRRASFGIEGAAWGERSSIRLDFEVTTENGSATIRWPNEIHWSDATGEHEERLPAGGTVEDIALEQFSRLIRGLDHSAPTWDDALAAAGVIAAVQPNQRVGSLLGRTP